MHGNSSVTSGVLELSDHFAAVAAEQGAPGVEVHAVRDEPDRAICHEDVCSTDVIATAAGHDISVVGNIRLFGPKNPLIEIWKPVVRIHDPLRVPR